MQQTKICSKCKRELLATETYFYKNRNGILGLSNSCKDCDKRRQKERYDNLHKNKWLVEQKIKCELKSKGTKICTKCGKELPATPEHFYRSSKSKDGLRCECKFCQQKQYKDYYDNKLKVPEIPSIVDGKRKCTKCGKYYDATSEFFYIMKDRKDNLSFWCKECCKLETKRYTKENHNIILQKNRERYNRIKNDPDYIERRKQYDKNRNKKQKFGRAFSRAVGNALKGTKAGRHWEDLVSYNLEQLRQHLESQFTPEMNWDNYGSYWEVDHIIPQNTFNFTDYTDVDFQICWSLPNLRPLTIAENRSRPKDGSDVDNKTRSKIIECYDAGIENEGGN